MKLERDSMPRFPLKVKFKCKNELIDMVYKNNVKNDLRRNINNIKE